MSNCVPPVRPRHAAEFLLIAMALLFLLLFLGLPLALVFREAFRQGLRVWWDSVTHPEALAALKLSLLVALVVLPINTLFGLSAAWALGKSHFRGRSLLITLIDLPFSISPVVAGLLFVLLFGASGWFGPWLNSHGIQILFAVPGMIMATLFVTFPFVARELIPLMQQQGIVIEEAAMSLGASGWQTFRRITLPRIRWGLFYGMVLCQARAMGEFGAVSVVSGHIRGETNTLPLHVEILYNEYSFSAAFAAASLLTLSALVTLTLKSILEHQEQRHSQS